MTLPDDSRYGLLGKGAILMLTAYPNRTSPVLRGAWMLERLLGAPPPAPPPLVPTLAENKRGEAPKTLRARLEQHRENPTCFTCHGVMDPLGFALENFSAVGQFRAARSRHAHADRRERRAARRHVDQRARRPAPRARERTRSSSCEALTENLMTFALGRSLDYRDMPTVRAIVRDAAKDDYRFESLVLGIVSSDAVPQARTRERGLDAGVRGSQAGVLAVSFRVERAGRTKAGSRVRLRARI